MGEFSKHSLFSNVWHRELKLKRDFRGYFIEEYRRSENPINIPEFVQDSISFSQKNVLRGMHIQTNQWQLISIISGEVLDILVGVDPLSDNYLKSAAFSLSADGLNQILVGPGVAHGYAVIGDNALIHYKSTVYYGQTIEYGVHWSSALVKDYWPAQKFIISERDSNFPKLEDTIHS